LIEDKIVASDNNLYHMRACVENNFGFNAEAKKTLLRCDGWIKDSDDFDRVVSATVSTKTIPPQPGFFERKKWIYTE